MAPIREELSRIGREGFAAIDKVYGCHSSSSTTQWPARQRQEAHQQQQQQVKLSYSVYRRAEVVSRVYQQTSTTHHPAPTNYNYIVHQAPPQDHDVYNYNYGGGGYGSGNRVLANSKLEGAVIDSKTAARRFGGIIHDVKYYAWF